MSLVQLLILVFAILLLFGGFAGHFGVWHSGPAYGPYYGGGIGIGTLLLIIILVWIIL
jgi:hypothetical protein